VARRRLRARRAVRTTSDEVIEPVVGDLSASMPTMNRMPETWPARRRRPFDVPSGTGWVTSAAYWNPIGPELRRKKPNAKADKRSSP
jgi:hypothetical protein